MMIRGTFAAAIAVLLLAACSPQAPDAASDVRALAEGETQVAGLITQVEDGGYPRFTLHIQPDGDPPLALYLDESSGVELGGATLGELEGQRATVYYRTVEDLSLLDVRTSAGASVMHDDGRVAPTGAQTITGVLSDAEVTNGDLPDVVTVTDAQGAARSFEYFVDEQFAAANGQQVTAYYQIGGRDEVTLVAVER